MPGMPDNQLPTTTHTFTQEELVTSDMCIIASELESDGEDGTSHQYRQQRQWQRRRSSWEERKRKLGDNASNNDNGSTDKISTLASPPPPRLLLVPPPPLVSPAFTPPMTPGGTVYATDTSDTSARSEWCWNGDTLERTRTSHSSDDMRKADGDINDSSSTRIASRDTYSDVLHPHQSYSEPSPSPSTLHLGLVDRLPTVTCAVRARIPTTIGTEMFLHLYHNNVDNKEHLAIVFGNKIRSKSLDAFRPGETEMDRMVRGAYTGRLFPGRASSSAATGPDKSGSRREVNGEFNKHRDEEKQEEDEDEEDPPPLVRIHSECYTGETVWSARCDCGEQLDEAARLMALPSNINNRAKPDHISSNNSDTRTTNITTTTTTTTSHDKSNTTGPGGVIVYLRQEGRGIGLGEKLKAYNLQDLGSDTYDANLLLRHPADARSYGLATAMLVDLGLGGRRGIRLLTNNPDKVRAVEGPGREVVVKERIGMVPLAWRTGGGGGEGGGKKSDKINDGDHNGMGGVRGEEVERYLTTKIEKFKHMLQPP